jgi:hypothetical protein
MATTGNKATGADPMASILNDPLYQEALKSYYNETYAPGLAQSQYNIGQARNNLVQNNLTRGQAQKEAIQRTAGGYASRGFRSPKMVTKDFAAIQGRTAAQRREEENIINSQQNQQDVLYGANPEQGGFFKNPAGYGSIGAGARRASLAELFRLTDKYKDLGLGY